MSFAESIVEQAALVWLESAGWPVRNGTGSASARPAVQRDDYGQVGLTQRLRNALLQQLISGELRV